MEFKKKGFTLTEILAVIVIIALLLLLVIPTIANRLKSSEGSADRSQEKIIKDATDVYMDKDKENYPNVPGNNYCISVQELINNGQLTDDIKDVKTGKPYDKTKVVQVFISDNAVRTFKIVNNGECNQFKTDKIVFSINPSNDVWAKSKKVTIYYPTLEGEYSRKYKKDNGSYASASAVQEVNFTSNGKINAVMQGPTEISGDFIVKMVDSVKPLVNDVKYGNWNSSYKQEIAITVQDNESGVAGYYLGSTNTPPSDSSWKKYSLAAGGGKGTINETRGLGKYYFFVKDKVGNVSVAKEINVTDNIKPACSISLSSKDTKVGDW